MLTRVNLASLIFILFGKTVGHKVMLATQAGQIIMKGIGSVWSVEGRAFLLTVLSLDQYHQLCNFLLMCLVLRLRLRDTVQLADINDALDECGLPSNVVYALGSTPLILRKAYYVFSLDSVIKLLFNHDVNTGLQMYMIFKSAYLENTGSLESIASLKYLMDLLGWLGYCYLKN